MRYSCVVALLFSTFLPSIPAFPLPTPSNTTALSILNGHNSGSTLGDIDGRFSIIPTNPGGVDVIPAVSTYLNTLQLLEHLAQADFRATAPQSRYQRTVPSADMDIVWTRYSGHCENRFLIWGLWLALEWFRLNRFIVNDFHLFFSNQFMGIINYDKTLTAAAPSMTSSSGLANASMVGDPTTATSRATSKQNGLVSTIPSSNDSISLTIPTAPSNTHLSIRFRWKPSGVTLGVAGFFAPIAAAMVWLAEYPSTDRTRWFYARPNNPCTGFLQMFGPAAARMQWPYLRNVDALLSLYEIASYAARKETFAELDWTVEMDDIEVGRGALRRQQPSGGVDDVVEGSATVRV